MSSHVYDDLIQGSEEWLAARRGIVTASVVGKLVTSKTVKVANNDDSRGLTALLVAERITGHTHPSFINDDMMRGHAEEPRARDWYSENRQRPVDEVGFLVREEPTWTLGFSPDGLVGGTGLIEVKAPRAKTHLQTILADAVPLHHVAQIQAGLLVTGREWCDFISWCAGMAPYVKRVLPDERWFDAITAACIQFEKTAVDMTATYRERTAGLPAIEPLPFLDNNLGLVF
jgi:hypothetical protein